MTSQGNFFIIGYGNPHRRDDGIGPYVIRRLSHLLEDREDIRLLVRFQLGPELIEDLKAARGIILVDATVKDLPEGREWSRIQPEFQAFPYLTHHTSPQVLLWLLQSVYRRSPLGLLVTVQGRDFPFGN